MNRRLVILLIICVAMLIVSCEEDDPLLSPDHKAAKKIKDTELLLRNNLWGFDDLIVDVKYEMHAIPLLAGVADQDGMVPPGRYSSYEIFGDDDRQRNYSYQFTTAKIYRDTTGPGNGEYYEISTYNVLNSAEIRINPDSLNPLIYAYRYAEGNGLFIMTASQLTNGRINDAVNQIIADAICAGKPGDLADAVVDKILGNAEIQSEIQQLLYDIIHGKVEEIAQNPEEISQKLAALIIQRLKEVDWESLLYEKLIGLLEILKVDDPELAAQELAAQIAGRIQTGVSQSEIYEAILPILQKFENETLPELVPNIAEAIYNVIIRVFSEENIYQKIYPAWIKFSQMDSTDVADLADTLGTAIARTFFDAETLAASLEPFIKTLRSTSTVKLPALAQDIIDEVLIPLVDQINATFPGLDLDPDWADIKQILTSALTVLKSTLDDQTDAEAAADLAENIINIMDYAISKGVEMALLRLQEVPADQAAQVLAAWINNLVEAAEPGILAYLEERLNALADLFNAEAAAEELSVMIHDKLLDVFSADNIYILILPVMERLSDLNVEAVAEKMAGWLSGLIQENISEDEVLNALTVMIEKLIGSIDVDETSQKLVELLLQSDIVENIDGTVLKRLIEFKTYDFLIEVGKEINAIDKIEIRICKK